MAKACWFYIQGMLLCRWGEITGSDVHKRIGLRQQRASSLLYGYEALKARLSRELDAVQRRSRSMPPASTSTRVPLHSVC